MLYYTMLTLKGISCYLLTNTGKSCVWPLGFRTKVIVSQRTIHKHGLNEGGEAVFEPTRLGQGIDQDGLSRLEVKSS